MRTKACEGVLRLDVNGMDVTLTYDGLGGISQRSIARDLVEELARLGKLPEFLAALQAKKSARLGVYFDDYVSYGIGGGDATAEFYFGSRLIIYRAPGERFWGRKIEVPTLYVVKPSPVAAEGSDATAGVHWMSLEGLIA